MHGVINKDSLIHIFKGFCIKNPFLWGCTSRISVRSSYQKVNSPCPILGALLRLRGRARAMCIRAYGCHTHRITMFWLTVINPISPQSRGRWVAARLLWCHLSFEGAGKHSMYVNPYTCSVWQAQIILDWTHIEGSASRIRCLLPS